MILLVHKLSRPFKFPSNLDDHTLNSHALSAFRSKISNSITETCSKPETCFRKCLELINTTNTAFAKMVVEIECPMSRWGERLNDEYLTYTLNLLDMLNSVNSSVSHLSHAKVSVSHAMSMIKNSPNSASTRLIKIPRVNPAKDIKLHGSITIENRPNSEKERALLHALALTKKIGLLMLGYMLSCLCSDNKPYVEIRKHVGGFDDSMIKELDMRFCKEVMEMEDNIEEVEEVNSAIERLLADLSTGRYIEALEDLKTRLEVLENSIRGIEKKVNDLFSEVLATRNKLLDNIRLTGENPQSRASFN